MEELVGGRRGKWSGLTFAQHLNQWITVRNAFAHNSIRHLINAAASPDGWNGPDIGDPYASIQADGTCARYRLWESDAVGDGSEEEDRLSGAPVQAWSARSCLAFIIQTVDWLVVDIAQASAAAGIPAPCGYRKPGSNGTCRRRSAARNPTATPTGACGRDPRCTDEQPYKASEPKAPVLVSGDL